MTHDYLDGNVLAGALSDVFAIDATVCETRCVACGRRAAVAELRVWTSELGAVARCAGCEEVVLRVAQLPGRLWLDLRGTLALAIPTATAAG